MSAANTCRMIKIGLISDTHDRLNPQTAEIFRGCQHIIHAGDLTSPFIMDELELIAPVTAARGNCDFGYWARTIPAAVTAKFEDVQIQVIHNVNYLTLEPDTKIVIYGHTHRARQHWGGDVLYINPGSASEPRYSQHPSVAVLTVDGAKFSVEEFSLNNVF